MNASIPLIAAAVFRPDTISASGKRFDFAATPAECAIIAERFGIVEVTNISGRLEVLPFREGLRLKGNVIADVIQSCVITENPVIGRIAEDFDRIFVAGTPPQEKYAAGSETFIDLEGEDDPDYFDGTELDPGEMLFETLSLGLDPFPRAEGAVFQAAEPDKSEDEGRNPFAALKGLIDKGD